MKSLKNPNLLFACAITAVALSSLVACGGGVVPADSGSRADVPTTSDAIVTQDSPTVDGGGTLDVPSMTMDVPVGSDIGVTNDVPRGPDASRDASPDASPDAGASGCGSTAECPRGLVCRNIPVCRGRGVCEPAVLNCGRPGPGAAVCGCDGQNYASECEAFNAGVGVSVRGTCPINPGGCRNNADCRGMAGPVCYGIMACGGTGRCQGPTPCNAIVAPVCGCDNMTYTNECVALNSGVGVASNGACGGVCRVGPGCCLQDADCGGRGYCVPLNQCADGAATGVCKPSLPPPVPGAPQPCWRNSDCGRGVCNNARICPCGAACILPDAAGTCG